MCSLGQNLVENMHDGFLCKYSLIFPLVPIGLILGYKICISGMSDTGGLGGQD